MKTRIFLEGENIIHFIREHIQKIPENSVLVITSKIVGLAESRTFLPHSPEQKLEYVKQESDWYMRTKYVHLTMRDGMPMANAGIDESNGNGKCILLPKDSYQSATFIRNQILRIYSVKNLGVIITDSHTVPFRNGTTGISLGHAGFEGIRDYVGKSDIFGRSFLFARTNVPDALAVSAVHVMGEGDECQPLAIIENPSCIFTDTVQDKNNLIISPEDDMYRPLFEKKDGILRKNI